MKIAISAESTCDLTKELLKEYDFNIVPFHIMLQDDDIIDGEKTNQEIFDFVKNTGVLPKTYAINAYTYKEYFENLLKDYDAVIHVALSSGISSSCGNAITAASELKNVYIVDSKSLSTGIALLMLYAKELTKKIDDPKKIYELVCDKVQYVQTSFVIETLDYLHKGGRCSSVALLGANLLKIRPRIVMTKEGKMTVDRKYKGKMENVIETYCQETLRDFNNADKKVGFIVYSSATPQMIEKAKSALTSAGFENIVEAQAGSTITCHCGPNTLGIIYFNAQVFDK